MSKCMKPCLYTGKALENQWRNCIYNSHDLWCGCNNPIQHLKEIEKRDKWLHTKDASTSTRDDHGEDDDFPLTEGDLDQLFEEEEKNTG